MRYAPSSPELRPAPRLSIVVPVFNEQEVLPLLFERLKACLDGLEAGGEVLLVNDGSRDGSLALMRECAAADARFKVLDLARNYGQAVALTAGTDAAQGDAVVLMDADLQDSPELIPEMIARYREGFDVVQARRRSRHGDGWIKRLLAWGFYRLLAGASEVPIARDVGEFRLMSAAVVRSLRALREQHRYIRGLVAWLGFEQTTVEFDRPPRAAGETKFPTIKSLKLAFDGLTSFSTFPLRLASLGSVLAFLAGLAYTGYALYMHFVLGTTVPGWTTLVILQVFFSSYLLLCMGIMGEYIGRIFQETKGRPLYFLKDDPTKPPARSLTEQGRPSPPAGDRGKG